jgi:DNA/RNA endonuclease YhcR with UshA esterase domain
MNRKGTCYVRAWSAWVGTICLLLFFGTSLLADEIIPWKEAHEYYGQWVTVTGRIASSENTGSVCILNFSLEKEDNVVVLIFRSAFDRFPPDPQDFYDGKNVFVTGKIQKYRGTTSITVPHPSRIKIVEDKELRTPESSSQKNPES